MDANFWFEDVWENERPLGYCANLNEVCAAIDTFIDECNQKWHRNFKRYYTRAWPQADGRIRFDVGSHSEFFLWKQPDDIDIFRKENKDAE